MTIHWIKLILPFFSALTITSLIIPIWIKLCDQWRLFDKPDVRKHHTAITPSLGGIGIFAGMMISFLLFTPAESIMGFHTIAAAVFVLFFTGFFDDLTDLPARLKLIIQAAAAVVVMYSGLRLNTLNGFMGIHELNIFWQYALTGFVILFLTNAYNFIDGLDGLAATIGLIIFSVFTILFYVQHEYSWMMLCLSVMGGLVSFLYFNFNPARIFMGDTGSLVVGFLIACSTIKLMSLWFVSPLISFGPSLTVATLFILIFDLSRVVFIRLSNGMSPFKADRSHLHHMICRQQFGHRGGTLLMAAFNVMFIVLVIPFGKLRFTTFFIFCFCLAIALINSKVMMVVAGIRNKLVGSPQKKVSVDTNFR